MKTKERKTEKRTLALSQIFILVIATVAFSWMIGQEIEEVNATLGVSCGAGGGVCTDQNLCTGGTRDYANDDACLPYTSSMEVCCIPAQGSTCNYIGGNCMLQSACRGRATSAGSGCISPQICCVQPCIDAGGECVETNTCLSGGTTLYPINSECMSGTSCCRLSDTPVGSAGGEGGGYDFGDLGKGVSKATEACLTVDVLKDGACTKLIKKAVRAIGRFLGIGKPSGPDPSIVGVGPPAIPNCPDCLLGSQLAQGLMNAAGAAIVAYGIQLLMKELGAGERNLRDIRNWATIGAGIGGLATTVFGVMGWAGPIVAGIVTAIVMGLQILVGYKVYSREVYTYRVEPWMAPDGGSECNKCNSLKIGKTNENACSEYICHTYGMDCEWQNDPEDYESCFESSPGDTRPPSVNMPLRWIDGGESVFPQTDNINYNYLTTQGSAKIIYTGRGAGEQQCIPPWTPVTIAFNTTENAHCKIIYNEAPSKTQDGTALSLQQQFDKMSNMEEGSLYTINHTVKLESSATASAGALAVAGYDSPTGGIFRFYIKCTDKRGNINPYNYIFQFCVQEKDITPPEIIYKSPKDGAYIKNGVTNITNFKIYTNEPAECRWDTERVAFSLMKNSFEFCSDDLNTPLEGAKFGCRTTLTNFRSGQNQENRYYIVCMDQPRGASQTERNTGRVNETIFYGTNRLIMGNIQIEGKLNNSVVVGGEDPITVNIEVPTYGGAGGEGMAKCAYKVAGEEGSYMYFFNGGNLDFTNPNTETFSLSPGNYKLLIRCEDNSFTSGTDPTPNINTTMINFSVQIDTTPPSVVRVYRDKNRREDTDNLKIITNEEARCVYSNTDCDYEVEEATGEMLASENGLEHTITWDTGKDYYIKCVDKFNHVPTGCSIIARPFEITKNAEEGE